MKTIISVSTTLCLFFGCFGKTANVNAQESRSVTYEQYYNARFGFVVDYPDFLIPQGESGNGDGQIFVSADGKSELRVYCHFRLLKLDYSRLPTLHEAYEEDLRDVKGITEKKIDDHSYFFAGKDPQDDRCFHRYTMLLDHFFVIHLLYPEAEAELFQTIADHVHESFAIESEEYDEDGFLEAGFNFLNECFYGKNFNTLLRDNDERLQAYIDPKMDVRRFYAPGTTCRIASRAEGFAFNEYDDFETCPEVGGESFIHSMKEDDSPCELVFKEEEDVAFCQTIKQLPEVVVDAETLETRVVETPYPNAEMKALYVPDKYGKPIGFYFIKTPDGWKLAFVDDSLCSA